MRGKCMALGAILMAAAPISNAMADEEWLCSIEVDNGLVARDRYRVVGDKIVCDGKPLKTFDVLQNTELALVGANSHFRNSPELSERATSGTLMIIDKRTGAYREVMILLDRDFEGPFKFRGTCRKR